MKRKLVLVGLMAMVMVGGASALYTNTDNYYNTDDFEDGSLSDYNILSGSASTTSGAAYLGSEGLELSGHIWNDQVTVRPGQTISGYFAKDSGSGGGLVVGFGGSQAEHYELFYNSGKLALQTRDNDGSDNILASTGTPTGYGTLRYEIHWHENGTMVGELYNESNGGDFLGEVSATDNSYGAGGVGYRTWNDQGYFDGSPAVGEHYVRNGDFEGSDTDHINANIDTTESYSGDTSLRVDSASFTNFLDIGSSNLGYTQVGETYKMVVYAKSTADQQIGLNLWCSGSVAQAGSVLVDANSGWNKYETTFTSNDNCESPSYLGTGNEGLASGNSVWIDRISIYKVGDSEDPVESPFRLSASPEPIWYDARKSGNGGSTFTQPMWDGLQLHNWANGDDGAIIHDGTTTDDKVQITSDVYLGESGGADGISFTAWGDQQYTGGAAGLQNGWTLFLDEYDGRIRLLQPDGTEVDSTSFSEDSGWYESRITFDRTEDTVTVNLGGTVYTLTAGSAADATGSYIGIGAWSGGVNDDYKVRDVQVNTEPQIDQWRFGSSASLVNGFYYTSNSGNREFDYIYFDDSGLNSVNYFRSDPDASSTTNFFGQSLSGESASGSITDIDDLSDGLFEYEAQVEDEQSLTTTSDKVKVIIDTLPPSFTDSGSPYISAGGNTNPSLTSDNTIDMVTGSIQDFGGEAGLRELDRVEYLVDGSVVNTVSLSGETDNPGTYTTSALSDGSHDFEMRAYDAAGNVETSQTFTTTVDTTPPSVSNLQTTYNGQTINDGDSVLVNSQNDDITISADVSDNNELEEAFIFLNAVDGGTDQQSGQILLSGTSDSISQTFSDVPDGNYSVDVQVSDTVDNTNNVEGADFEWQVDDTSPTISNVDFSVSGQTVNITADISDNQGIDTVDFNLDGTTKTVNSAGTQTVSFSNVDEGKYNWVPDTSTSTIWKNTTITATDSAGNTDTWEPSIRSGSNGLFYEYEDETFLVDVTDPTISSVDHRQDNFKSIEVENFTMDDNVGMSHMVVEVDGETVGTVCNNDPDEDGDQTDEDLSTDPVKAWNNCDATKGFDDLVDGSDNLQIGDVDSSVDRDLTTDFDQGNVTVELMLYDGKKQTDSLSFTQFVDTEAPKFSNFNLTNLDRNDVYVRPNDTLELTVDVTDNSDVAQVQAGFSLDEESRTDSSGREGVTFIALNIADADTGNLATPTLTHQSGDTYRLQTTLWDLASASNRCYNEADKQECLNTFFDNIESGEVDVDLLASDDFANKRQSGTYETGLYFDGAIDFRGWKASSPLNKSQLNMRFVSRDDFTQMDSWVLERTESPNIDLYNVNNSCYAVEDGCSVEENHKIEATNNGGTELWLYYKSGEKLLELDSNETDSFYTSGNYSLGGDGFFSVFRNYEMSEFKSDLYGYQVLYYFDIDDWTQDSDYQQIGQLVEDPRESFLYESEANLAGAGIYKVKMNLTDQAGNNEVIDRQGLIRPDSWTGKLYQFLYNSFSLPDWVSGLMILLTTVIGGAIGVQLSFDSSILTKVWTWGSLIGLIYWGGLPFQIHVLAGFMLLGLVLRTISRTIWGGN